MIETSSALALLHRGLCVLPADPRDKRPTVGRWKQYQKKLPEERAVRGWFDAGPSGICIVCGRGSGNLEVLDFDAGGELYPAWAEKIDPGLLRRLAVERTPSGGLHVYYRCHVPVDGNLKLAVGERGGAPTCLIETRGEGGLVVCSPTPGYTVQQGTLEEPPTLTADERASLLAAARALDERPPVVAPAPAKMQAADGAAFAERPGDDWNERGDLGSILVRHGWRLLRSDTRNQYWRRPGKEAGEHSATFDGGVFYVFSSNAAPFEPNKGYSKFQAFALLECGGDYTAAARTLLDQGYGIPAPDAGAKVDLSRLLAKIEEARKGEPVEGVFPDPGPMPDDLLSVPGFVNALRDHTMRTAPYPNKMLAFAGALAMLSLLSGRRFKDRRGGRCNVYLVALAESGAGKDHPRKTNVNLAAQGGFLERIGDTFASGEGLEDAMEASPCMLFQLDEADYLFQTMKQKDARAEVLNATLLKFYGASSTVYMKRRVARPRGRAAEGAATPATSIVEPHLVLFGTAIPRFFYEALTQRSLENGLLARCLIVEAGPRGAAGSPHEEAFPAVVEQTVRTLLAADGQGNLAGLFPRPRTLDETPGATKIAESVSRLADERYAACEKTEDGTARALWARAAEKVHKLAMLHAISANPATPRITEESYRWAWRFVEHLTRRMLYMCSIFVHESEYQEQAQRIVRMLQRHDGRMTHSTLLRGCHLDKDTFRKVMGTLVESGEVLQAAERTGQRESAVYLLPTG